MAYMEQKKFETVPFFFPLGIFRKSNMANITKEKKKRETREGSHPKKTRWNITVRGVYIVLWGCSFVFVSENV